MLDIEYKGGNTVILSAKQGIIAVDPKLSLVGLKDFVKPDMIELATEERFALNAESSKVVIAGPGDFGVSDFDIHGVALQRHLDAPETEKLSTGYRIVLGDHRIALLGNVFEKLSDDEIEELGVVDILILPIGGGGYTLDAVGAAKLVAKIDPKVVIPTHYTDPALTYEVPQDDLERFTTELGANVETMSKLKLKAALQADARKVIVLERS